MNQELVRSQLKILLRNYPYVGTNIGPLEGIMKHCAFKSYQEDDILCKEGDPGQSLFFLLSGSLRVTRLDRKQVPRELAIIQGPTIIGHMSLIDRTRRSATCTISERAYIGVLSQARYERLIESSEIEGVVFRRLLLASLQQQLYTGIAKLRGLISDDGPAPAVQQDPQKILKDSTAAFSGWASSESPDVHKPSGAPAASENPPVGGMLDASSSEAAVLQLAESWKRLALERARSLPMEDGARLLLDLDTELPFTLELNGFTPSASKRTFTRFIRFLNAIPTPPQAVILFNRCPSDQFSRSEVVSKNMRLYFEKHLFTLSGTEERVEVQFLHPDERWLSIQWYG